jgi:hypothetical protein
MPFGGKYFVEVLAKRKSITQHRADLTATRTTILDRARAAGDSDYHRKVMSHIIGIERWGQSRLRVFLGGPLKQEEYDGYRPARESSYTELLGQFEETRQATLKLVDELAATKLDPAARSLHNMFGPLTVQGWLYYLCFHANAESIRRLCRAKG